MSGMQFVTCIRMSCQLLLCDGIFVALLPRKKKFPLRLLLALALHFAAVYGLFSLLRLIPSELDGLSTIIYCSLTFASTIVMIGACFDIPKSNSIASAVSGYCVQHITYSFAMIIVFLTGVSLREWNTAAAYLLIHTTPYVISCALVFFLVVRPFNILVEFKEHDIRIAFLSLVVIMSNVILSEIRTEGMGQPVNSFTTNVVCGLYAVVSCMLVIFLQYSVGFGNKTDRERSTVERVLDLTRKQYEMSKENIDIINMKCHDLKHQITALRNRDLSADGEWVDEIERSIDIYDRTFKSGNSALDVVLTEKSLICERYGIDFGVIADGACLSFMSSSDTYSLFGNIIDNAIERLLKEEKSKRYISVNISKDGHMVFVHVENYCGGEVVFRDGMPVSDKGNKDYHGFGTKSIVYIAKKYGGDAVLKQSGDRFCVDIVFGDK